MHQGGEIIAFSLPVETSNVLCKGNILLQTLQLSLLVHVIEGCTVRFTEYKNVP